MRAPSYPRRHWEVIRDAWRWALQVLAVTGGVAGLLGAAAFFWHGSLHLAAIAVAIFLFALLASLGAVWDCYRHVTLIPYFERTVGEIDTFCSGYALARHLGALDELAARLAVPPLSSFGFADDMCGETLVWHPAEEGLGSVLPLMAALQCAPDRVEEAEAVLSDLEKLAQALRRAHQKEIRFCFLLRHGNTTSGLEWERRQGTAF